MNQQHDQSTIGQEFTSHWMGKRNPARYNSATLMRDMTEAVDDYVASRPEVDQGPMREIALEAADGNETFFKDMTVEGNTIRVTARELLRSPGLVAVANRHHLGGPNNWQFPV